MDNSRQGSFYRPELDCLRFFAFLLVFLSHAFSPEVSDYTKLGVPVSAALWLTRATNAGGFGVALFFLLSSYLITELLLRERSRTGKLDVKAFYMRRALRIWPLYFAFLIVVFVVTRQSSIYALPGKFFLPMLLLVGNWAAVVYNGMGHSVAGPLWSISVEEQFYLAWPPVIARLGARSLRNACFVMIVIANVVRVVMEKKGAGFVAFWCGTFTWLDTIAAGALLAIFLRGRVPRLSRIQRILLGGGGLAIWIVSARFGHLLKYPDIETYPVITAGSLMMMVAALGSSLAHPLLVYLGRISYGLYVFHVTALLLASFLFTQYSLLYAASGLVITMIMAAISYRWLEEPFLKLKKRFTIVQSRPVEATLAVSPEAESEGALVDEAL